MPINSGDKQAVRLCLLRRRRSQSPDEVAEKSARIARQVLGSEAFERAKVVMGYLAMADEVQTQGILEAALDGGKEVVLPRVSREKKELDLYRIDSIAGPFEKGPFGILEPVPSPARSRTPDALDLILVPGVGFDEAGGRIGFGAGYYDRLLAACPPETVFVGLAFELQVIKTTPVDNGDVAVHELITEERHILCHTRRAKLNGF